MKSIALLHVAAAIALGSLAPSSFAQSKDPKVAVPTNQVKVTGIEASRMPWQILEVPQIGAKIPFKPLQHDEATGMAVFLVRYPAGFTNTWHTHPHAHGMYVLDGVLKTHQGEFGPGSWVWFPEGGWMEHGATAKADVTFLFVTNKEFGISYATDPKQHYPFFK